MTSKHEMIKNQFDSAASFYGVDNDPSVLHIFSTRVHRISELLGDLNGLNVLDVGCGPGFMIGFILEKKGKYFGLDMSQNMLHEAKTRHESETPFYLSAGDMEKLPFQSTYFDLSLCLGSLEYVEDLERAVAEISRVMREDSIIIMSMQNRNSIYRWWERHVFPGFLFNALRKLLWRSIVKEPIERLTTIKDLKEILSLHHFVIKDVVYYNFNLWIKPFDSWFPTFSVKTTKKMEFLFCSKVGFLLAADFLVKAQKVI